MTLAQQFGTDLGQPDGVIVFDPSSLPRGGPSRWEWHGVGAVGSERFAEFESGTKQEGG